MLNEKEQLAIIKKAKQRIYLKKHWTQGVLARDKSGMRVSASDPAATCWCALGALIKEAKTTQNFEAVKQTLYDEAELRVITKINDRKTPDAHRNIIRIFNKAIKSLEERLNATV